MRPTLRVAKPRPGVGCGHRQRRPDGTTGADDRTSLAAVRRVAGGTEVVGSLLLEAPLTTNVVGVGVDGRVAVGAGTADGVRVWEG